jgi:hypothetical protein
MALLTPFELIKKGATGLINQGKGFFNAPDNSTAGIIKNTVLGLPKAAKETFVPTRGYTEQQLKEAKPTLKESVVAAPKIASEIYTSVGRLGEMGTKFLPGYNSLMDKIVQTKTGNVLSNVIPKLEQFQTPKTVGEAKAMRFIDIAGLAPVGSIKNIGTVSKVISKLDDVNRIANELQAIGIPNNVVKTVAPKLIKETNPEVISKIISDSYAPKIKTVEPLEQEAKTKSQLEQIWKEAKKYKSAEEFVKAQGTLVYRGGTDLSKEKIKGAGISVSKGKNVAEDFVKQNGGKIEEIVIDQNAKIADYSNVPNVKFKNLNDYSPELDTGNKQIWKDLEIEYQKAVNWAKENGYDGIKLPLEGETRIINKDVIKTKSQLEQIWKEANKGTEPVVPKPTSQTPVSPLKTVAKDTATPLTTGEARSLEKLALQQEGELLPQDKELASSLDNILQKKQTDVKNVVGIHDYIRTPEKVFKKMGLEPEFGVLRKADEAYKKQLPQEIDKITEWSKRVPKESNERIFKYLDGQAITLRDDELKVANEIKQYLSEWADKLGLPEDKRVSNYITHLFEEQFITRQFDEDIAKIIADRVPGSVYDPFLEKRLGALGYKQDTWAALDAYVKRATRKVNLDPALEIISKKARDFELTQYKYVKRFLDKVNMRPSEWETAVDNTIKQIIGYRLGQRPVAKLSRIFRQMAFRGMIGGNVGSPFRNLSQGVNTYAKLGEKYTTIGYLQFARKGTRELKELGILGDNFITDRKLSATKKTLQKLDDALFSLFDGSEKINRGSAFYGARAKALAEGKTLEEATNIAKKLVRETQFNYGAIDTPLALQGDLNKLITQFLSYPVKQTEFLLGMAKDKNMMGLLRYALAGVAFVYTAGKAVGMEPKELIPFSGIVSGEMKMGTPPSLKLPVEIGKAVFNAPDKYGQTRDIKQKLSDIGKTAWGMIPGGTQMKKTLEGINLIEEGGSFNKAGNLQFLAPVSKPGKTQAILFGKYASQNAKDYFDKAQIKEEIKSKIQPTYDKVQQLKAEGKIDEAKSIVDSLSEEDWKTYKEIRTADKTKQTLENKKKVTPIYTKVQQLKAEGKIDEAKSIVDSLSDEEWNAYKLVKKQVENDISASKGNLPTYEDGEPQTVKGVLNTVLTYAKAIGADPVTAFNRIFTGQKIRYVTNGTIVVERMPLEKSQELKEKSGQNMLETKLDHTIPLQLGGSNAESNLNLVPNAVFETYTPIENAIGKALRDKKISKKEAQDLIKRFKNGEITSGRVLEAIK